MEKFPSKTMITKHIFEILKLDVLPEINNDKWSMADSGGCECEVGEFLYGFMRMFKPERILETGLYSAISTIYMAMALRDNGFGHIETIEYEREHIKRSKERLVKLGVGNFVTIHEESSLNFMPSCNFDIMFLDTEPQIRFKELINFYPYLNRGGFVFIHDLPNTWCQGNVNPDHPDMPSWPWGDCPQQIKDWVNDRELVPWNFPSPRGLSGLYRPRENDYKFI